MKTFNKNHLAEAIEYNGETYQPNRNISGSMVLNNTNLEFIKKKLRLQGRKCILVKVLSNNLKGKNDLHGKPYQPSQWIYTNDKKI